MNIAFALSLIGSVMGVVVSTLSFRFGAARGWERYRLLALVALTASLFGITDAFSSIDVAPPTLLAAIRCQGAVGALHVAGWVLYTQSYLRLQPSRWERLLVLSLVALAPAWLVPGWMIGTKETRFTIEWLHVTYANPETTILGGAAFSFETVAMLVPLMHYARAKRAGVRDAGVHLSAGLAIWLASIHDTLVTLDLFHDPLLLSLAFLITLSILGFAVTRSFVENARALEVMSATLERLVEERTHALVTTKQNLLLAEKMAALGHLAAGVAHEINNPAAAITANLTYLREGMTRKSPPADALECVDESLESVGRIAKIVRQLLEAGRTAASAPRIVHNMSVSRAVRQAVSEAKLHFGSRITASVDVGDDLRAKGDVDALVQVLVNVIVNGAQAIEPERTDGRLSIRAREIEGRISIEVTDNGAGMSEETKRRMFEPFFTTKPFGLGTGLGLPVSLGLVRSMGGDLRVESRAGMTTVHIELERSTLLDVESAPALRAS
ncbi:sensor histidine kinase [Labilithrix luteola]|uniref:sensor histidine kinase n=1 Tax=Labilithrix luteola TaxID=1391654 RepID=UPI0011BAAC83|nr:ATP-binding protein [Labilithrix luteola]